MHYLKRVRPALITALAATMFGLSVSVASEQTLNRSLQVQSQTSQDSVRTQIRIGQLADQTQELLGEYRVTLQQLDRLRLYNAHLQRLVNDQEREKADIHRQLTDFEVVEKEIVPLMQDMIETIDRFVQADVPFLPDERGDRLQHLRDNMDRSDMTISEKYRQIMSAYQIETDYGRTMETYEGRLDVDNSGVQREVDFLRIGRILLAYQTLDREYTGFWNKITGHWEELPNEYRRHITEGLRIARKQAAPNLLKLPVSSPEAAQ